MHTRRRWFLIGTVAVMLGAMATLTSLAIRAVPAGLVADDAPLAVVLVPAAGRSELVVVDLVRKVIVRRIALRSLVTDIEADPVTGMVVGAQTGGIGNASDDAVSLTDPRDGAVRYVTLPWSDPSQVECVAGRALVLHSWIDGSGFAVSVVDPASASVVATGHAPDGTGLWTAAVGRVWTSAASDGSPSLALVRLSPADLATSVVRCDGIDSRAVVEVGERVAVMGARPDDPTGFGRLALIDPAHGTLVATAAVAGLPHGAQNAALAKDVLVIGDWNGDFPESSRLAVLDAGTLAPLALPQVGTAPCAFTGFGDRLLVVDRLEGVLRSIDPRTGVAQWCVDLGVRDMLCSKVVVVDRALHSR
jgi:hypothetical protein